MISGNLYQIIYVSSAQPPLTEEVLIKLLSRTQERNAARDITGLLLHSNGSIIQIIEGPKETVEALYAKISQDARHSGVTQLTAKEISKRDFPNFKMGFKRVNRQILDQNIPGFSTIVEDRNLDSEAVDTMSKMVATFLKSFARSTQITSFDEPNIG